MASAPSHRPHLTLVTYKVESANEQTFPDAEAQKLIADIRKRAETVMRHVIVPPSPYWFIRTLKSIPLTADEALYFAASWGRDSASRFRARIQAQLAGIEHQTLTASTNEELVAVLEEVRALQASFGMKD